MSAPSTLHTGSRAASPGWLDWALWPVLVTTPTAAAAWLLERRLPGVAVTVLVVGVFTALVAVLERARPDRVEHVPLDQPLHREVAHFLLSFELGYGLALAASAVLAQALSALVAIPRWPGGWPMALQMLVGVLAYEATSYWQHRLFHARQGLWRFHALHHSGPRLNLVRAVRFHAVDIFAASFVAYAPLIVLGAPDRLFTLLGVLLSTLGVLQHANVRVRTPAWLDWLVCTPAVHRHHHSIDRGESDRNFGNTLMIFDVLFGTYARPRPGGPAVMGIEDDQVPRDLWGQISGPFRR